MAAPIVTGTSSAGRSGGSPLTFAHTAAGDVLFVCTALINSGTVTGITYGGAALTRLGRAVIATYDHEWWYMNAPTPGTANVVITTTGPVFELCGLARNVAGLSLGAVLVFTSVGGSPSLSLNVPSVNEALVLDFLSSSTVNVVFTVGAGQTLNVAQNGLADGSLRCAASSEPGAASVAMSWTFAPNATVNSSALSATPVVVPGGPIKAKLGNKHGRTDENGAIIVAVGATPGTPGVIGPLTVFPHLCGETTATGGLQVTSVTAGALRTKPTDLGNLRVTTDDQGSLRVATVTAGVIGPLTDLGNLQCRTDETGALLVTSVGAGSLVSAPSPLLNLRGRTDDQGALVVTGLSNPLAYQQRILADGAVAYWPLNDAVGSTSAVDLAGPRNAVISGDVTLAQSGGPGTSKVMLFGSTKTGMLAPPSWPLQGLAFTHELWIKPTVAQTDRATLLYRQIFQDGDFQFIYIATSNAFRLQLFQGSLQTATWTMALTVGAWLYVVLVCTGTQAQLYLNTVAQGLQAILTGGNGGGPPGIANFSDGPTLGFVGAMSDVAVYQKVLAVSDINAHYALRTTT